MGAEWPRLEIGSMKLTLVCFAVKEEASFFKRAIAGKENVRVLVTGMGKRNAERGIQQALETGHPDLVISAGFAGGLRADLAMGTVVFCADRETGLESALLAAGAQPGRFLCVERVAATAKEKKALWKSSGADAVEMESEALRAVCRQRQIPSATIRVILDTVEQNLPLDFNLLMTDGERLSWQKLMLALAKSPGKIPELMGLQKQSVAAARQLGEVLGKVVPRQGE